MTHYTEQNSILAAMIAEAKDANEAVRKSQGQSHQQAAAQRRTSGICKWRGCKDALLKFFQENKVRKLDDLVEALPFDRSNIINSIKELRQAGYCIETINPGHGTTYHFHGKQEATQ